MVQFYFFKAIVAISTIARELPRTHTHYLLGYESPIWMRKDLLFCNTENHVKLAFPLFWVRFNFCCFKSQQPPIRYLFLCASLHRLKPSLHSCPSGAIVPYLGSRKLQLQKERRGYAFASTQAGSVQQRTCSSLSLSSQLPVWLIVLSGSTP